MIIFLQAATPMSPSAYVVTASPAIATLTLPRSAATIFTSCMSETGVRGETSRIFPLLPTARPVALHSLISAVIAPFNVTTTSTSAHVI